MHGIAAGDRRGEHPVARRCRPSIEGYGVLGAVLIAPIKSKRKGVSRSRTDEMLKRRLWPSPWPPVQMRGSVDEDQRVPRAKSTAVRRER
jgi:hypothetical protein